MHLLPVLGALAEKRRGEPLAIIGVHSAKFDGEQSPDRVKAAVERYGLDHPVVVDRGMAIWDSYGIQAWPTVVLIRPDGRVAASIPGEVGLDALDRAVGELMAQARKDGTLGSQQLLPPRVAQPDPGVLAFPGKVLAAADGRIFVSDSRHHRVLVLGHDGRVLLVIGSGTRGRREGSFHDAELDDPQGLALDAGRGILYVADGGGQTIWAADLAQRTLSVAAGTGRLGEAPLGGTARPAAAVDLRTPWDLALAGRQLFVAMAGAHQIAVVDLDAATIARYAGNGRESIADGSPRAASFAQPSGLSLDGDTLYVADSESSAVRALDLRNGETRTLVGTGLFDWGDRDGPIELRMLQHPLAVAASPGGLWVADSYNGKIKRFSPGLDSLTTVLADAAGLPLLGPAGLSVEPDGSLLVADTDRSRLLRLAPGAREAAVLPVRFEAAPAVVAGAAPVARARAAGPERALGDLRLPEGRSTLALAITAPDGFAYSEGTPWSVALSGEGDLEVAEPAPSGDAKAGGVIALSVPLVLRPNTEGSKGVLHAVVRAVVCDSPRHRACYPVREAFRAAVSAGPATGPLSLPLSAPAAARASRR